MSVPDDSPADADGSPRATRAPSLAVLAQSGAHNHLHGWISLVTTAIGQGGDAVILLTHEALQVWLEGRLDEAPIQFATERYGTFYESAIEDERVPSLEALLAEARSRGRVRIFGCQASVLLWRKYEERQLERLDAIIGHTTFLQLAAGRTLVCW